MHIDHKVFNNFLDKNINEDILNWMFEINWIDGKIRTNSSDNNIRTSKVYYGIEDKFKQEIIKNISKKIQHIKGHEFQLTMNSNGDFYRAHPDTDKLIKNKTISRRKWTLIYYIFNDEKPFDGGDIIIYDKHDTELYDKDNFIKISPENNMSIFFPSDYWHEVTTIKNDGNLTNNRFTINVWLH